MNHKNECLLAVAGNHKQSAIYNLEQKRHEDFWYSRGKIESMNSTLSILNIEEEVQKELTKMIDDLEAAEQKFLNR